MLDEKQIAQIERQMREEHRRDLEALQRLKKYLPANGTASSAAVNQALKSLVGPKKAIIALQLLIEGTSIRSAERISGLHRDTIMRLLVLAGERCEKLLGEKVRNVPVTDVKCDEIWGRPALCLHFAYYNFCRVHRTLRVTPAMESGLTDHVWTIAELLAYLSYPSKTLAL